MADFESRTRVAHKLDVVAEKLEEFAEPRELLANNASFSAELAPMLSEARDEFNRENPYGPSLSGALLVYRVHRVLAQEHYRYKSVADQNARILRHASKRAQDLAKKPTLRDRFGSFWHTGGVGA